MSQLRCIGICIGWAGDGCWRGAGAVERLEAYAHGAMLGGGCEALLGFAEGAVRRGHAAEANVYAAACRCFPEPVQPSKALYRQLVDAVMQGNTQSILEC